MDTLPRVMLIYVKDYGRALDTRFIGWGIAAFLHIPTSATHSSAIFTNGSPCLRSCPPLSMPIFFVVILSYNVGDGPAYCLF